MSKRGISDFVASLLQNIENELPLPGYVQKIELVNLLEDNIDRVTE